MKISSMYYKLQLANSSAAGLKSPKKGLFFTDESPENTDTKPYFTDTESPKKLQMSKKSRIFVVSKEIFQHWHTIQGQAPE